MNELVFIQDDQALTTSLKVAEVFEKKHKDVLEKIRFLAAEISATKLDDGYSPQFIEQNYKDGRGKTHPIFLMNRDGFAELVGNLNGKKAREWKRKYYAAFKKMEDALIKLLTERNSEEWKEARRAAKISNKKLMDTIQKILLPYIRANGYQHDDALVYMQFNRMINKIVGIQSDSRDKLTRRQLCELETINMMTAIHIERFVQKKLERHEIYSSVKKILSYYVEISCLNERFSTDSECVMLS